MMRTVIASAILLSGARALPSNAKLESRALDPRGNCFPFGSQTLDAQHYTAPGVSRDQWWCKSSQEYGFLGFSYPVEDSDCGAYSNSFESMNADFAEMKRNTGAKYVRMYYPACTEPSVFENALKAAVQNNMALIPQIWFNFGDDANNSIWHASRDALVSVLNDDRYKAIAPYVIHSADFGSEPIGDGVDNGNNQFVADLATFRKQMNSFGIPAGFSDDWNRDQLMEGDSFTDLGQRAIDASDYIHMHPMPFYANRDPESQSWEYVQGQVNRMRRASQGPILITETQWAWGDDQHYSGRPDTGDAQYAAYWHTFDGQCQYFKNSRVGWFLHA